MKIAVFSDVFLDVPGGIPSSILAQKKSLEELGHEVVVFAPGFRHSLSIFSRDEQKTIFLVPTHPLIKLNGAPVSKRPEKVIKKILLAYPEFDFDVVHVNYEASCSIAGMKLARRFGRKLVQTMHGREDMAVQMNIPSGLKTLVASVLCFLHGRYIPHSKIVNKDQKLANTLARAKMWTIMVNHANYANEVITPSQQFAEKLRYYGVKKEINVVSNGVDDEMVAEIDKRVERVNGSLVRRVEEGDVLRIFWNSRLSKEKRIMPFLEALAYVKEPFFCTFVGDGNALNLAKKFVGKNGLDSKVQFYGRVPHAEVLDKMLGQHLSATVSFGFDTQGLTLLEAEATGLPVFFCDPDLAESVPDGGGVMSKSPDPKAMAKTLSEIARNPGQIEEMSKVMLESRREILQSTQIKKLLAVFTK